MDLGAWLRGLGLGRYEQAFRDNDVDADLLPTLAADDLRELGVASLGHRKRLLAAIAALAGPADPRPSPAPHAERRQLTAMFVDLAGSTTLSARLDPEEMQELLHAYQDAVAGEVACFGGHVAKFMGDGVLCYFGFPWAHEDDAERAVRAGLAVATAVARLRSPAGEPLAARSGIATGIVVVGELIGEGSAQEQAVVGEAPNLAARLQVLAEPGGVVVADRTRRLVGGLFECADLGSRSLKGFAAPVPAWRIIGLGGAGGRFEALRGTSPTRLVDREQELALLLDRWCRAKDGEGQVALLCGEAGIGKSRIVRALRDRLGGEPRATLRYQCSPHHGSSALWPVIEQPERTAGLARDEPAAANLDRLERLLAQAVADVRAAAPLIADLLGLPMDGRYPAQELSPQQRKAKTFEALLAQLAGLAARGPVLTVLEDAHWLDPTSQELFDQVVQRLPCLPVLLVVTFRPEFRSSWTDQARATLLTLERLDAGEALAIAELVAGGRALPANIAAQIVARTDGVPLFLEELTKTVLETGLLRSAGDRLEIADPLPPFAIPSTLHDSLLARLDRLGPVKAVAQLGAVIGREFSHALLAAVTDLDPPALTSAVRKLAEAELVFAAGEPPDAVYTFKHALVQDAAYASLIKPRRRQLHARVATALEERFPELAETRPEVVARHCTEAGLTTKAVAHWHRAGRQAVARSAMKEAVAHLAAGLEALRTVPWSPERDQQELDLQVTLGVALLSLRGQAALETGQAYARARELAERLGDTPRLLQALYGQSAHHATRADFHAGGEAAAMLLRLAQKAGDVAGRAAGHRMVGVTSVAAGNLAAARMHLEAAIEVPGASDHPQAALLYAIDPWVAASGWLAWPLLLGGHPEQARACHHQSLVRARERGHPNTLAQVLYCGCVFRQLCDDPEGVEELARTLSSLATEQAFPYWLAMATIFDGWTLARAGEVERAGERVRAGFTAYRATGAELWQPYFMALSAEAHEAAGRTSEVLQLLDEALERVARSGERWYEAELHRFRGELLLRTTSADAAPAEACFRKALDVAQEQGARWCELRATASLARLWAERGERRRAHDLVAPVCGWFSDGSDMPGLREMKALVDGLG